jgi:enoyl-CoA hydratase/carnithine racemase
MSAAAAGDGSRVTVTITGGVADVRMNRPDKRNALDPAMMSGLVSAGERLKTTPGLRAIVLSGEGPDFCAGIDLSLFRVLTGTGHVPALAGVPPSDGLAQAAGQRVAYVWAEQPVPVIAAIRGNALGGGLQVALGADIRIAAPDARLSVFEVNWGLIPDMTGTQLLPELVGRDVAKELTFTSRIVSGTEAARIGLVTRTDPDPLAAALALAGEIAARSPHAVRAAKRLLDLAGRTDLATGLASEQAEVNALIANPNQAEAVAARLEKRAPAFTDVQGQRENGIANELHVRLS